MTFVQLSMQSSWYIVSTVQFMGSLGMALAHHDCMLRLGGSGARGDKAEGTKVSAGVGVICGIGSMQLLYTVYICLSCLLTMSHKADSKAWRLLGVEMALTHIETSHTRKVCIGSEAQTCSSQIIRVLRIQTCSHNPREFILLELLRMNIFIKGMLSMSYTYSLYKVLPLYRYRFF